MKCGNSGPRRTASNLVGSPGFETKVSKLELRVGGALHYSFTAVGENQIKFMQQSGQPLTQHMKARYTHVQPKTSAAWQNLVEFVPGNHAV